MSKQIISQLYRLFFIISTVFIVSSLACNFSDENQGPDVHKIKIDYRFLRFEQDLFAMDTNKLSVDLEKLAAKYPYMLPLFANNLVHDQTNPEETPHDAIRNFILAPSSKRLFDTVQRAFENTTTLENQIRRLLQYHHYYFPEKPTPEVVTFISEFATDVFTAGDSLCGIGLDMFLGQSFAGYNPDIFPAFIRRQFEPAYIPVRLAKALSQNRLEETPTDRKLLNLMVYNGKLLYLTKLLQPTAHDSTIMGYTLEQIEGCYANEQEVWAKILEKNLLFSADYATFRKLVEPGPNAPIVFQEAPGEVGNWIGWQIVKAYMKRNPNTSPQDLIKMKDAQKLLEKAKYKPRSKS